MKSPQEVFLEIQTIKKKQRDIRAMVKDALAKSLSYKEATDELATLREKKKVIEQKVKNEYERELAQLDDLKIDLETEMNELSDMVLSEITKGNIVKLRDAYNKVYDPIIKIAFKKSDEEES